MITYNHERYIVEAIEGVLMQKTDFKIKLFITDDKSPDSTVNICQKYADKYPDIIDFESFSKNKGSMNNWIYNLKKCLNSNADYIAICEGDDYWTDPLKLQKQFEILSKNKEFNVSVGRFKKLYQTSNKLVSPKERVDPVKKQVYDLGDYLKKYFSQTSTFMIRATAVIFPDWLSKVSAGDQSLIAVSSYKSKIHYNPDYFSVYRVHEEGVSRNINLVFNTDSYLFFLDKVNEFSKNKYNKIILLRKLKLKMYKIIVSTAIYKFSTKHI